MWLRRAALVLSCALGVASAASAHDLSAYEKESIQIALREKHAEIDPDAEGKWIEDIDVVTLEVFEDRDPVPHFANWFHITTRSTVVAREVLLRPGERYDTSRAEESERNLREQRQLSVVLIVPIKGSYPDRVRLLVVTKDVWSLRLNWNPSFYGPRLRSIILQPSEENLAGRHKIWNATIGLGPLTYTLGMGFQDPRIAGSRLDASFAANVVFNCKTNDVEGSNGSFVYGQPLYSTRTKWSWVTAVTWNEGLVRPLGSIGQSICNGDRAAPVDFKTAGLVPYQYHQDLLRGQISATRSFGIALKNDISFGLESNRREYRPPSELAFESPAVQAEFRMPVSDTRLSPFVQLHAYENRYHRVIDLETLGLQEDYRLGHDVWLRAYPALRAAGSSRDLFGVFSGLGYTVPISDGLATAFATSTIEVSREETSDAQLEAGARVVTPRLPFGRVIADAYFLDRYKNYLNPLVSLGGLDRLRGYLPQAFVGPDAAVANFEIRSRPVEILSVQVGVAAFYDMGDTAIDVRDIRLRHGAGGGLRLAFPQIQRAVFRLDFGVPLNRGDPYGNANVTAQFEQAFNPPGVVSPDLVH